MKLKKFLKLLKPEQDIVIRNNPNIWPVADESKDVVFSGEVMYIKMFGSVANIGHYDVIGVKVVSNVVIIDV